MKKITYKRMMVIKLVAHFSTAKKRDLAVSSRQRKEVILGLEFYVQCNHLSIMRAKQRCFPIRIESIYKQPILTKGNSQRFILNIR